MIWIEKIPVNSLVHSFQYNLSDSAVLLGFVTARRKRTVNNYEIHRIKDG